MCLIGGTNEVDSMIDEYIAVLGLLRTDQTARVPASWLWSSYVDWSRASRRPVANRREFSRALQEAGAVRIKSSTIVYDLTPVIG